MSREISNKPRSYDLGDGTPSFGRHINWTDHLEFRACVQADLIDGWHVVEVFGEFDAAIGGMPAGFSDVWMTSLVGGPMQAHIPDSGGEVMALVSDSDEDKNSSGDGAHITRISYLDPAGVAQVEHVPMNGLTPVVTPIPMSYVNKFEVSSSGDANAAVGNIALYKDGGSIGNDLYSLIAAGLNRDLSTDRMVPAGTRLLFQEWHAAEAKGVEATFHLWSTDVGGLLAPNIFNSKCVCRLKGSASPMLHVGASAPAGSVVKISVDSKAPGSTGSAGWWGYLVDV